MEDAPSTLVGFDSLQKKEPEMFIPEELLTNGEVKTIVREAFENVVKALAPFGKFIVFQKKFLSH